MATCWGNRDPNYLDPEEAIFTPVDEVADIKNGGELEDDVVGLAILNWTKQLIIRRSNLPPSRSLTLKRRNMCRRTPKIHHLLKILRKEWIGKRSPKNLKIRRSRPM